MYNHEKQKHVFFYFKTTVFQGTGTKQCLVSVSAFHWKTRAAALVLWSPAIRMADIRWISGYETKNIIILNYIILYYYNYSYNYNYIIL